MVTTYFAHPKLPSQLWRRFSIPLLTLCVVVCGSVGFLIKPSVQRIFSVDRGVVEIAGYHFMRTLKSVEIAYPHGDSPKFQAIVAISQVLAGNGQDVAFLSPRPDESIDFQWRTFMAGFPISTIENIVIYGYQGQESWCLPVIFDLPSKLSDSRKHGERVVRNIYFSDSASYPSPQSIVAGGDLTPHFSNLGFDLSQSQYSGYDAEKSNESESYIWGVFSSKESAEIAFRYTLGPLALYGGAFLLYYASGLSIRRRRWILSTVSVGMIAVGMGAITMPRYWQDACHKYNECQSLEHGRNRTLRVYQLPRYDPQGPKHGHFESLAISEHCGVPSEDFHPGGSV